MPRADDDAPAAQNGASTPTATKRRRGRPPKSPEAHAKTRRELLDATRAVYPEVGYHGLNVELIVKAAGVSRPTFYKHFGNVHEPIEEVIRDVHDALVQRLLEAMAVVDDPVGKVDAGLAAWRDWLGALGPLLAQMHEELHDSHSPSSEYRQRTVLRIREVMMAIIVSLGRPKPTRLSVDAMLNGVEYLGYRFHLDNDAEPATWKETRDTMMRLALALLGGPEEWANLTELAEALDVDLNPGPG